MLTHFNSLHPHVGISAPPNPTFLSFNAASLEGGYRKWRSGGDCGGWLIEDVSSTHESFLFLSPSAVYAERDDVPVKASA